MNTYKKFCNLNIDKSAIGLGKSKYDAEYFCTPVGAEVIGYEGVDGIHYCFIPEFGDYVFAVNPMSAVDEYVYPLAKNFEDFLSLIITCNSTAAVEQIVGWDIKELFEDYIKSSDDTYYCERKEIFGYIKDELNIGLMYDPFEYVKELQEGFPYAKILFSDEFYDWTGWERP